MIQRLDCFNYPSTKVIKKIKIDLILLQ